MATLAQMRSRIADDLNRSDLNTQIDKAINRAIIHYGKSRFFFNEGTTTFNTVASQKSYGSGDVGFPTDILSIDLVQATVNGVKFPLVPKTYDFIAGVDSGTYTGYPEYWAWYTSKLWLYPTPNGVYTITLSYVKSYTALTNDNDTNAFTENAEDLIEARARWWLYSRIIQDREESAIAKNEELEAFEALVSKNENYAHLPTGLQPTVY